MSIKVKLLLINLLLLGGCALPTEQMPERTVRWPKFLGTANLPPAMLKIGLLVAQKEITLQLTARALAATVPLEPGRTYRIGCEGKDILLAESDNLLLRQPAPLQFQATSPGTFLVKSKRYRGNLEAIASPGQSDRLTLVNLVATEEYLYGVVPAEMPSGWPLEALKAQAIAARTYAYANLGRRSSLGFDLYDNTADQVYGGMAIEQPDTTATVDATRREIVVWQFLPIAAFFHAASGGETDDAWAVWGEDFPYIRGFSDLDPSPHAHWETVFTNEEMERALAAMGSNIGELRGLEVVTRTPHGRARWLQAIGSAATVTVDANTLRFKLGLKSTRYQLSKVEKGWRFLGGGWGHGLGMSQWGARAYAQQGVPYQEILTRYYDQTSLARP
ncbi:MAG: SpoIID/LytB domain-containing protein [Cyanobacteria bacterium NC_groundwater_1444_Ag_S-0.65um_54_12]|nr:SpoIID/LytB domain-containing protein [Cyanobacteria bacterium NC_groundwater_1444_Ag_S-0.65um_54_12]